MLVRLFGASFWRASIAPGPPGEKTNMPVIPLNTAFMAWDVQASKEI